MNLADILGKLADGETLSVNEKQDMMLQVRRMQEAEALLTSLIQPGTKILNVDGLVTRDAKIEDATITDATITDASITTVDIVDATITSVDITDATITNATISDATFDNIEVANAQVSINEFGVFIANQEGLIGFESTTPGATDAMSIYSNNDDFLIFQNQSGSGGFVHMVDTSAHEVMQMVIEEDPNLAKRLRISFNTDPITGKGERLILGSEIYLQSEGAAGGSTQLGIYPSSTTPSDNPDHVQVYFKSNKIIFRWSDSGTIRYKYLDLTGTGVTWVHTTSAP